MLQAQDRMFITKASNLGDIKVLAQPVSKGPTKGSQVMNTEHNVGLSGKFNIPNQKNKSDQMKRSQELTVCKKYNTFLGNMT